MKKKQFLACLLVLAMALGLFAGCSKTVETPTTAAPTAEPTTTEAPTPSQDAADLVLTGGTIQTMVGEETAEAVAVKDGIIVYVGDSEGAKAYIADSTQVIDLEGKFVSPGFIDGHTHDVQNLIIQGGIVYLNETDPDIELYKAALQAFVDEHPDALDYKTGKAILQLLQDTGRKTGMTIIIITHNGALTAMADRVIRVHSGTVVSVSKNEHPQDIAEIEW